MSHILEPQVLRPFHRSESISIAESARIACKSDRTIRSWCRGLHLGRKIGGQWVVSKVALAMFLEGNTAALRNYLSGDRMSPMVTEYFERLGVPLMVRANAA
jgi:hypothetical protein